MQNQNWWQQQMDNAALQWLKDHPMRPDLPEILRKANKMPRLSDERVGQIMRELGKQQNP